MAGSQGRSAGLKAETAYDYIRKMIESGQYPGGSKLTLQGISAEVGVSLTPVREALRMLQANGLVEYKPHHGHVVTRYSIERAEETYMLRSTLEPLATELAASKATEEELAQIRELDEQFTKAVHSDDTAQLVELNSDWHRAVYRAAHSTFLDEFIDRLWSGVPYQAIWFINRTGDSAHDHRSVTDALLRRDGATAAEAMRTHIQHGRSATIAHLKAIGAPLS